MRTSGLLNSVFLCLLTALPSAAAELKTNRSAVSNFTLTTLKGEQFKFESTKGKVVVISFWASWCKPCIQELGYLKKLAAEHASDMIVLAVSTDAPNTLAGVRKIVQRKRLTMPVLLDSNGAVMNEINPRGTLPFSVYIDRQGRIGATHDGFSSGDEDSLKSVVQALIAEKNTATAAPPASTPSTSIEPKKAP